VMVGGAGALTSALPAVYCGRRSGEREEPGVAEPRAPPTGAHLVMAVLDAVLGQVRQRVDRYRGSPIGEQNTKAALIEPVLRALGWDVEDIEEVQREYKPKSADNPVDYALLVLRTPRLFLEAKGLGGIWMTGAGRTRLWAMPLWPAWNGSC
jgi:hypothetical protein